MATVNNIYPIILMLNKGETNLYPNATVFNKTGTVQGTYELTHSRDGCYINNSWTPSVENHYYIIKKVYTDAGYTTPSPIYGNTVELVKIDSMETDITTITGKLPTHYIMGAEDQTDWSDEISNLYTNWNPGGDLYKGIYQDMLSWLETLKDDWLNDGRLDVLLDAVKAKTDTIVWTDITFIKDCEGGGWKRDSTKLYLYKSDNATLVAEFNLKDADGDASGETDHVFQRDRV